MNQSSPHNVPHFISEDYRKLNAELHQREAMYGTTGRRYVDVVRALARKYDARHLLDYGCGKRDLWVSVRGTTPELAT